MDRDLRGHHRLPGVRLPDPNPAEPFHEQDAPIRQDRQLHRIVALRLQHHLLQGRSPDRGQTKGQEPCEKNWVEPG